MKINAITLGILVAATSMTVTAKEGSVAQLNDLWRQGDVEFNLDGFSHSKGLVGQPTETDNGNWDMNGRIRLGVGHTFLTNQGVEIDVFAQPLLNIRGTAGVDDASISFAGKDSTYGDWKLKLGRYEAFDMFPLNQDTFIEYSGDTANDLYSDGSGYAYQMKEGRGRSNHGGGILIAREVGPFYFETNTLIKDGTGLFEKDSNGNHKYHGNTIENRKNAVVIRPVIAYNNGPYTAAIAGETNVVHNAYGYKDANGKFVDQSDRTGYGLTLQYNTQKTDPENGVVANLSAAQLHAQDERDFSIGANVLYKHFELGYIYANNDIHDNAYIPSGKKNPGNYDIHTVHASYNFTEVAGDPNMNVELGSYVSFVNGDSLDDGSSKDRYGVRARVKYYF